MAVLLKCFAYPDSFFLVISCFHSSFSSSFTPLLVSHSERPARRFCVFGEEDRRESLLHFASHRCRRWLKEDNKREELI